MDGMIAYSLPYDAVGDSNPHVYRKSTWTYIDMWCVILWGHPQTREGKSGHGGLYTALPPPFGRPAAKPIQKCMWSVRQCQVGDDD